MTKRIVFLDRLLLDGFIAEEGEEVILAISKEPLFSVKGLVKAHVEAGVPVESYIGQEDATRVVDNLLGLNLKTSGKTYRYRRGDKVIIFSHGVNEFYIVEVMEP